MEICNTVIIRQKMLARSKFGDWQVLDKITNINFNFLMIFLHRVERM